MSCSGILNEKATSSLQVFAKLAELHQKFEQKYQKLLQKILRRNLKTAICTIYNPNYPDPEHQTIVVALLSIFNDVIIRQAFTAGIPLIDLRLTCTKSEDFANPIEPSELGGEKIVNAIINTVSEHNFARPSTQIFYSPNSKNPQVELI